MIEMALLGLAIFTFVYLLITIFECLIGFKKIQDVLEYPSLPDQKLPTVTIIFSALNEENSLEQSLKSLLALSYPHLEILAVNDRSTDKTASILGKIREQHDNLHVFHIQELPDGWLGKTHALYLASQHAKGDWLLFTDADVIMKDPIISQAVSYAVAKKLDHLTIHENHLPRSFWLRVLLFGSYLAYVVDKKPWRVRYAWSKRYVGHGAFNLINKAFYLKCGGHKAIAMECLDDMKLGLLVKKNRGKQDLAIAKNFVEREWYNSFIDMFNGLKKNAFAHFNYHLPTLLLNLSFGFIIFVWPPVAALFFPGPARWVNLLNFLLSVFLSNLIARKFQLQKRLALFYPLAMMTLLYTVWNSAMTNYKNKGIFWRNTFYSLDDLRRNSSK